MLGLGCASAWGATATLSVNAATAVNTFIPAQVFGTNLDHGQFSATYQTLVPTLQSAGIRFLRYPGGSGSDLYHWNGTGSWNGGVWIPSQTSETQGFNDAMVNNGTSAAGLSMLTDGLTSTAWVSNPDTDFPNAQWVYVDLGSTETVTQVQLYWGTPYATSFNVQYWNPNYTTNQWAPYQAATNEWEDSGLGSITGTGGQQTVNVGSLSTRYVRIFLTASSAGTGGNYSIAELSVFDGSTQLTSNTTTASSQSGTTSSSMAPNSTATGAGTLDFDGFMALCNSYSTPATPLITVNFGTGSAQEAAAWVYYANVVKGYGVKYWEIGNEMMGNWEAGGPLSATDYGRRFDEYAAAMHAVDPSVVLLGPVSGPTDPSNNLNSDTFIQDFATRAYSGSSQAIGGIDIHVYASYNTDTDTSLLATPANWTGWGSAISSALNAAGVANASSLPVVMSEYNANSAGTNITVRLVDGLWLVDWLGQYLTQFGSRAWANFFALINSSGDENSATAGSFSQFEGTPGPYLDQPFASFWAMQMMSADWAIPNDTRTHDLVSCVSSATNLIGYADLRPDGDLALIVSNQDPSNAYTTTISIAGYSPQSTATTYNFSSAQYAWETSSVPYHVTPDSGPAAGTSTAGSSFSATFAPYSLTVFQFCPAGSPTPSPSPSPAWTQTPTPSPTVSPTTGPTACATELVYDGASGANLASGNHYTTDATVSEDAAAAQGSAALGLDITYSFSGFWGALINNFTNYNAAKALDLTTYDTLEFWVKVPSGNLDYLFVVLGDSSNTNSTAANVPVNDWLPSGVTTVWQKVDIPLSAFTGINKAAVEVYGFVVTNVESGYVEVYVNNISFLKHCATPTPSPSPTPSASASRTPTASPSPTATGTGSSSPTASSTATSSPTATGTLTATGTATPAGSPTDSPTISPTFSASPTLNLSLSPTSTFSDSPSATATPSATPTATASPSPSASVTSTDTASATPSATATFSSTASPTGSASATASATASPTGSFSASASPTLTPSVSAAATATESPTASATALQGSATATETAGATPAASGPLVIDALLPVPNPNPGALGIELEGPADSVRVRVYTQALIRVRDRVVVPMAPLLVGWNLVPLPAEVLDGLAHGLYFLKVEALRGGASSAPKLQTVELVR
jgi:hypothetical protein